MWGGDCSGREGLGVPALGDCQGEPTPAAPELTGHRESEQLGHTGFWSTFSSFPSLCGYEMLHVGHVVFSETQAALLPQACAVKPGGGWSTCFPGGSFSDWRQVWGCVGQLL